MEEESVLIVDDNPAVANVVAEGLPQPGNRIAGIASTGEDEITTTSGANPDSALMDIGMRGGIDSGTTRRSSCSRAVRDVSRSGTFPSDAADTGITARIVSGLPLR